MTVLGAYCELLYFLNGEVTLSERFVSRCVDKNEFVMRLSELSALTINIKNTMNFC